MYQLIYYFLLKTIEWHTPLEINQWLYLADWKHWLMFDGSIFEDMNFNSDTVWGKPVPRWYYNDYGPDLSDTVPLHGDLRDALAKGVHQNLFVCDLNKENNLIFAAGGMTDFSLSTSQLTILDFILEYIEEYTPQQIERLVNITYPIQNSSKYSYLNLQTMVHAYRTNQ